MNAPHPALMTLRVLWFAFISTHPIFIFVVFFVASSNTDHPGPDESFQIMLIAMSLISVTMVPLSLLARRFMMGKLEESADDGKVAATYQTGTILRMAFAEAITINGFVLAFISMAPEAIIPFAAVGVVCSLLAAPRAADLTFEASASAPPSDSPRGDAW